MAKNDDIIREIRARFREAETHTEDQYRDCVDDLNFLNGDQWPRDLKADRESDGRPCLVINKMPTFSDQVSGDIRQNTPTIKVKPVDSDADPDVAEIYTGLIRNIEVQSSAGVAYDTAGESAVNCGIGAFRIVTEYADDGVFDQDIRIKRVKNPLTIYWDPMAQEFDKCDAKYAIITEKMDREEYKKQYPKASVQEFQASRDKNDAWSGEEKSIRIAEYFRKEPARKKLYLLQDPGTGEQYVRNEKIEGFDVIKERDIESHKIEWFKTNGHEILEGPTEFPSYYIPIVMVYGKELNIEDESIYRGVIRHAKDPQRLYNYSRSTNAEVVSLAPKSPWIVTAKNIGAYKTMWDQAHKRNYPYLPFKPDPKNPQFVPQRQPPIPQNTGLQTEILISDQEIHDTTGLQLASLGKESNEKSGKAIQARQREGDTANFAYYDNLARALTYAGKVIVDMIPRIYDTARIIRILGEGDEDKFVPVNQPVEIPQPGGGVMERVFDLTTGKYDVTVTIGPSYQTQREEAADNIMAFITAVPQAGVLLGDLIAKYQDWPGAQEIEKRLKTMLPPGLADDGNGQGPEQPPQDQPPPPEAIEAESKAQLAHAKVEGQVLDNKLTEEKIKNEQLKRQMGQ